MLLRTYTATVVLWHEIRERLGGDDGATAVEYALMLALIAAVIVGAVTLLGQRTSQGFSDFNGQFASAS
ncbi:MAG: Flp family type IVb pilin [Candidatus Velamenicoccus archaeovorus]